VSDVARLAAQLAALREAGVVEAELSEKGELRRVMFGAQPLLTAPAGLRGPVPPRDEDEDRFGSTGYRPGPRGES